MLCCSTNCLFYFFIGCLCVWATWRQLCCGSLKVLFHLRDLESSDVTRKGLVRRRSVLAVVVIHVPSEFFWVLLGRVGGLLSLFGLVVFPCHRRPPFYDLGCVSASNRRRCSCYVVGFRLPLDLCLCCCFFLGEDVLAA